MTRAPSPTEHQASVELYTPHGCEYSSVTGSVICGRAVSASRNQDTTFKKKKGTCARYTVWVAGCFGTCLDICKKVCSSCGEERARGKKQWLRLRGLEGLGGLLPHTHDVGAAFVGPLPLLPRVYYLLRVYINTYAYAPLR